MRGLGERRIQHGAHLGRIKPVMLGDDDQLRDARGGAPRPVILVADALADGTSGTIDAVAPEAFRTAALPAGTLVSAEKNR